MPDTFKISVAVTVMLYVPTANEVETVTSPAEIVIPAIIELSEVCLTVHVIDPVPPVAVKAALVAEFP